MGIVADRNVDDLLHERGKRGEAPAAQAAASFLPADVNG